MKSIGKFLIKMQMCAYVQSSFIEAILYELQKEYPDVY